MEVMQVTGVAGVALPAPSPAQVLPAHGLTLHTAKCGSKSRVGHGVQAWEPDVLHHRAQAGKATHGVGTLTAASGTSAWKEASELVPARERSSGRPIDCCLPTMRLRTSPCVPTACASPGGVMSQSGSARGFSQKVRLQWGPATEEAIRASMEDTMRCLVCRQLWRAAPLGQLL